MKSIMSVKFSSVEEVKQFVEICSKIEEKVVVESDVFRVNGKSILGMLSLDLSQPVMVLVAGSCSENFEGKFNMFLRQSEPVL